MVWLPLAIRTLIVFSLFVQMSNGATYAVVPFINRKCLGSVAGIVGAGGNTGAVAAGFLFKGSVTWPTALLVLGIAVTCVSFLALLVRFPAVFLTSLVLTVLLGLVGDACSVGIYRILARPAWDSRRTSVQFFTTTSLPGGVSGRFVSGLFLSTLLAEGSIPLGAHWTLAAGSG